MNHHHKAPLGVLVVGAGDMGHRHASAWAGVGAHVIGICDVDLTRAQQVADHFAGAEALTNYQDLLSHPKLSAVSICTPTMLHAPVALACIRANKHVLCEKPIALTLRDAHAMHTEAKTHDVALRIGFIRRFTQSFAHCQTYLKAMNTPLLGSVKITAGIRPKRLMHDAEGNGGPIIDMCCHVFDMWRLMFGEMPTVHDITTHVLARNHPHLAQISHKATDSALVTFKTSTGITLQMHVSWGLPEGIPTFEHHTYTSAQGLLSLTWDNADIQLTYQGAKGTQHFRENTDCWHNQIAYFYKELTQGAPQRTASASDGIAALELSLAILNDIQSTS